MVSVDAILLAGGRASRVGGAAKPLFEVGGRTLLHAGVDAVRSAEPPIVHGECVLAGWQPGGARARRVMRRAQQDAGGT